MERYFAREREPFQPAHIGLEQVGDPGFISEPSSADSLHHRRSQRADKKTGRMPEGRSACCTKRGFFCRPGQLGSAHPMRRCLGKIAALPRRRARDSRGNMPPSGLARASRGPRLSYRFFANGKTQFSAQSVIFNAIMAGQLPEHLLAQEEHSAPGLVLCFGPSGVGSRPASDLG